MANENFDARLRGLRTRRGFWLRLGVVTLLWALVFTPVFAALDWVAYKFASSALPGPTSRHDLGTLFAMALLAAASLALYWEWRLDRGFRQVCDLVHKGDQIGAAKRLHEITGYALEYATHLIQHCLDEKPTDAPNAELPEEVRRLADEGKQLKAVEKLAELTERDLTECMKRVEEYLASKKQEK